MWFLEERERPDSSTAIRPLITLSSYLLKCGFFTCQWNRIRFFLKSKRLLINNQKEKKQGTAAPTPIPHTKFTALYTLLPTCSQRCYSDHVLRCSVRAPGSSGSLCFSLKLTKHHSERHGQKQITQFSCIKQLRVRISASRLDSCVMLTKLLDRSVSSCKKHKQK